MGSARKLPKKTHTVFVSGALFDLKQLVGNAYLAEAVYEASQGRYLCQLPQDLDLRQVRPQHVRDQTIRALLAADLGLFIFDGAEVDGGTLAEFMLAKFADIPAVILRTDVRRTGGGEDDREPWTIMARYYPRTVVVRVPSLQDYRALQRQRLHRVRHDTIRLAGQHASATAGLVYDALARRVVRALEKVRRQPPRLPRHLREETYQWLALMPRLRGKAKVLRKEFEQALAQKVKKDLL